MANEESLPHGQPAQALKLHSANDFRREGICIADWARLRSFNPRLVYAVLRDQRKCLRGESYQIAKELGMK